MSEVSLPVPQNQGLVILYNVISLVLQTLGFGMHLLVIFFGIHTLLKRQSSVQRTAHVLLAMLLPFLLSSLFWILRFAEILVSIVVFPLPAEQYSSSFTYYFKLVNAIILVNYLIADGVVVLRAWTLCRIESRRLLLIPFVSLMLTIVCFLSNVGLRVFSYFTAAGPNADRSSPIIKAIDLSEVLNAVWSSLTNLSATIIICLEVWRYRKVLKAWSRNTPNKTEEILVLIVESGFLYSAFALMTLAFALIRLPAETIGDIYNPIALQFASAYPAVVVIAANLQSSVDQTLQWQMSPRASSSATRSAMSI